MAIVDQYGSPYAYTAARGAAQNTGQRPWEPVELRDIGDLVPAYDRATLVSASRRLYLNHPILSGSIEQRSMYCIGKAWAPKFTGADKAFGDAATEWLTEEWFKICDVAGPAYDFQTGLYNSSNGIDRDGGDFIIFSQTDTGYPQIQHIPSHRVGNPRGMTDGPIASGPYRNAKLVDGIVYNRAGTPIAIAYISQECELIKWVSMRDCIHVFDPTWQEQGRGLPAFTTVLNALRDSLQSHEWEQMAQLMMSSIGLIEKNETGAADMNNPESLATGTQSGVALGSGITTETFAGGTVRYFKANSGAGLEEIKSNRPGDSWDTFQDRIYRLAFYAISWPYSFWKPTGQGTAERSEIEKAQRAIEDRQQLLLQPAKRMVGYAVAKAQKLGILPPSDDWYRWEFTMPRKLTIDDGRVGKELNEGFRTGYINIEDILGMHGKTLEEHYDARGREIYVRKKAAEKWSIDGIEIEEREMCMLTPNEQSEDQIEASGKKPTTQDNGNSED